MIRKIAMALVVSAAVAPGAAFIAAAEANASPANPTQGEMAYVLTLQERGITHPGGVAGMILGGYDICNRLRAGMTETQVISWLYLITDVTLDRGSAAYIVGAAEAGICPDQIPSMGV